MIDSRNLISVLTITIVLGFVSGVVLAAMGVWLVYLGSSGHAKFSLFGQEFTSTNVGTAGIFIGSVTIVLVIRNALKSVDHVIRSTGGEPPSQVAPQMSRTDRPLTESPQYNMTELQSAVSRLSRMQKAILARVVDSDEGMHISDLMEALGLNRAEAVYRTRDLEAAGLVEVLSLTDLFVVLSGPVQRLLEVSPGVTKAMLLEAAQKGAEAEDIAGARP